jgi:hypothetical protein
MTWSTPDSRSVSVVAGAVAHVVGAVVVDLVTQDVELGVERHLDLAAVVATDLDVVGGAIVPGLALGDGPTTSPFPTEPSPCWTCLT